MLSKVKFREVECKVVYLNPNVEIPTNAAYFVLKLLALAEAVLGELCLIGDELCWCSEILLLQLLCFP